MSSPQAEDMPDLGTWLAEHYDGLLKAAWFCTWDPHLAQDIAQDASVKIMKAWPDSRQRAAIITSPGYVRQIVVNAFRSHLKNLSRTNKREVPFIAEQDKANTGSADIELRMAILELPENERTLLILRYEGYTILEAGRLLGLSRDQAYRLNEQAKRSLDDLLKD